jgi:glycosyltransferase involved in cell wall biosynthesis
VRLGAVPEIVEDGVTGAIANDLATFADAARSAVALDRRQVRAQAEGRYSASRMAEDYAQLYQRIAAIRS